MSILSQLWNDAVQQYIRLKKIILRYPSPQNGTKNISFYRQMFERNAAAKLVIDPSTGQIIEANQAACQFYGYTAEQFKSMRATAISTLPESELLASMRRASAEKGSIFQTRHRLASGLIRDVEVFAGLIEVSSQRYLYLIVQDISDRIQAEKTLRESEALYRLLARNMPRTSVVMFDTDMRCTLAEGPFLRQFGLASEALIGKTPHEYLPEASLNFILPLYKRALQGESFSYDRVTEDYAYEAYMTPIRDDGGQIIGGMCLSHDISDRIQAQKALRESESRFRSLIDFAPVGIIETDIQGKRVFCNARWCEMTGISLEEALRDVQYETIYPDDLDISARAWAIMMATHRPFENAVFRYQRPDKTIVWVSGNGSPLFDAQGAVTGYLGAVTDISQRKQAEQALRESEARYRTLVDFAPIGIVETDIEGNVIFRNALVRHFLALSDEQINDPQQQIEAIHPDDRTRV